MTGHCWIQRHWINNAQDIKSYEINTLPKDHVIQKVLLFDAFLQSLLLGIKTVSVNSKHYDPLPGPWQPWGKSSKLGKFWPPAKSSVDAQSPDFPWNLYFNKFYTFPPLSRSQIIGISTNSYGEHNIFIDWKYVKVIWWYDGETWNWLLNKEKDHVWQTFKSLSTTANAPQFNFRDYAIEIIGKQRNIWILLIFSSMLLKCNS